MKSDGAIKTDIYRHIKGSDLAKSVSGKLSKTVRPKSKPLQEDIVISIVSNQGIQLQTAVLNVNIYTQDNEIDGQFEENTLRVDELCSLSWSLLESFRTDEYHAHAIEQRVYQTDSGEHIINNQVEYKLING